MSATSGENSAPCVSIIIPSRDGHRDGAVPRLLDSIAAQDFRGHETILITGVFPQGKAINQGAARARGRYLVIMDDDAWFGAPEALGALVAAAEAVPDIGMAGASILPPPDATPFQRRAARQFPRFETPLVETITDSDLACHGCCLIPRDRFHAAGGEREDIVRGLDPDLRMRLRAAGWRVVLAPGAVIHHPLPDGLRPLLRLFFRNGAGAAYAWKHRPETVYETHERLHAGGFVPRRGFAYRALRFPLRLLRALVLGQWLRFAGYAAYAAGYGWAWLTVRERDLVRGS